MPRRLRRCRKQSNLTQENSENNAKYVNIGEKNINTWYTLKEKLHFKCDRDFVEYLLIVVEKYLKSKLDIRLVEEEPELHNPAIPPSNFRQNVDEGESRILSTVDGNSVSVLKKVSDEILALSCKEGTELEVCGTTTIDGKKQSNPPNEKAADELCYEANSTNEEQVRIQYGVEDSEKQEVGIYRNARNKDECYGFVKPKKKRHKFDSKKRIEVYEELPSLDKTKDDPPVQPLPEDSLVASANFSEPVATAISSITAVKSCLLCDARHSTGDFCPLKSPTRRVHDFIGIAEWRRNDEGDSSYAHASLPECLELRQVEGGLGIFCKVELPQYTEFGPLVASPIKEMEIADDFSMKHIWEVAEGRYLSSEDETKSNWLRWLRPAPIRDSCNIVTIRSADRGGESNSDNCNQGGSGSQLYFLSTVPIKPGDELIFWTQTTGAWASKNMDKTSCGGCNLKFDHSLYYRLHCSIFHEASLSLTVRKYHCKVCGAQVLGKQNIMKHAALYHNGKGAYQCQFCSKYFLRLNYLEMHRNYGCSANPHRARPLCDYCGRKFCQPQKLKVHIKRMHSG